MPGRVVEYIMIPASPYTHLTGQIRHGELEQRRLRDDLVLYRRVWTDCDVEQLLIVGFKVGKEYRVRRRKYPERAIKVRLPDAYERSWIKAVFGGALKLPVIFFE